MISESKIEFDTVISESKNEFDTVISESKNEFDTVISQSKNEFAETCAPKRPRRNLHAETWTPKAARRANFRPRRNLHAETSTTNDFQAGIYSGGHMIANFLCIRVGVWRSLRLLTGLASHWIRFFS